MDVAISRGTKYGLIAFFFAVTGLRAQIPPSDLVYYTKLIEVSKKLAKIPKTVSKVSDGMITLRDLAYRARSGEAIAPPSSFTTTNISDGIDLLDAQIRDLELPDLSLDASELNFPDRSRESTSLFLTGLTQYANTFHGNLREYYQKQREIDVLDMRLKELKNTVMTTEKIFRALVEGGMTALTVNGAVYEWLTFADVLPREIGLVQRHLKDKSEEWSASFQEKRTSFYVYKSRLQGMLLEEKLQLKKEHELWKKRVKALDDKIKPLEEEVARLRDMELRARALRVRIDRYGQRIQQASVSLARLSAQMAETRGLLGQTEATAYDLCPNKKAYTDCTHEDCKNKFTVWKAERLKKLKGDIADIEKMTDEQNRNRAAYVQSRLQDMNELNKLNVNLSRLPESLERLKRALKEKDDFLNQTKNYYTPKLVEQNAKNLRELNLILTK